MYVCEYMHTIRYMGCGICISLSAASLTLFLAAMSAPFSRRREHIAVRPLAAARCRAILPSYNNRETKTGQIRQQTHRSSNNNKQAKQSRQVTAG